jgi:hypothetical protein
MGTPGIQADRSNIEHIDVYGELVSIAVVEAHVRLYRVISSKTLF